MNRKRTHKLTLEPLEDRCVPAAGFLDPTFGTNGLVTTKVDGRQHNGLSRISASDL